MDIIGNKCQKINSVETIYVGLLLIRNSKCEAPVFAG